MPSNKERGRAGIYLRLTEKEASQLRSEAELGGFSSVGELLDHILGQGLEEGENEAPGASGRHYEISRSVWFEHILPLPRKEKGKRVRKTVVSWLTDLGTV